MIRRRDPFDATLLDKLDDAGEQLPARLRLEITAYEAAAVAPLSARIGGDHWGAVHAVRLIRELGAGPATGPLIDGLLRCDPTSYVHQEIVETLVGLGADVVDPLLRKCAEVDEDDHLEALASVLCRTPGPRADVRAVLESLLPRDPALGCCLLAEYGDPAGLEAVSAALDGLEVDRDDPGPFANQGIIEAAEAIVELGGVLSVEQQGKLRAAVALANRWRRARLDAPLRKPARPGRNEPCWCGSGRKYKRCHEREDQLSTA